MKKLNNTQKALKRMIRDTESKITDEELFLSSAFQKYQTSLAKAATGRSRYGLQVLMEWDSSENADIAYTDNYRIHCNAANSITQSFPSRFLRSQSLTGLTGHEIGHLRYHNMIQYSGNIWGTPHPDDLSRCENYSDFLEKLNHCIRKFFLALRKGGRLAILVGDMRLHGKFYSMQNDLMRMGDFESFLVKGQFNCVSDNRTYKKPFIPIVTEYALLLKKTDSFIIPFSIRQEGVFSVQNTDILALTWHHLIRMTMESIGGRGALKDLYDLLKEHPKAKKNPHYQERIRATLYEHPDEYIPVSKGYFRLSYPVT